ncbi:MAG: feruloyl-CoA synthase [Roseibium sp.]
MNRTSSFTPHSVSRQDQADGSILLRSNHVLGSVSGRTGDWLHLWAKEAPNRTFLAERSGAGWREETYATTLEKVRALAASLLSRGLNADTPILIMSGNSIDHGILSLAAQYAGVPTVPVAEQYSLIHGAHGRLRHAIELVKPKMAYVIDAAQYAEALALDALDGVEIVASRPGNAQVTAFDDMLKGDGAADVEAAFAAVTPDTVAKILMTSGSTSEPKGVLTTQRMMCVNQTQIADALPFLRDHPPRIVDWLPWNHVFGGSHNFNMMLSNGGSFYIDDGKPVKGLFERTIENLSMVTGTLSFNVPVGFSMQLEAMKRDVGLRKRYFENLELVFYAGASLPQEVWKGLEDMAMEIKGEIPLMTSSWGMTETAPAAIMQQEPINRSGVVGVPLNGATLKLLPDAEMRCEVRIKGPNIMPGYFNDPEKTKAAFDEDGYLITGDAMIFIDEKDPSRGLRFDGRISEDFKLLTGTWVRAAGLRADLLSCLAPLASDLVITGQDRNEIGALVFPDREAINQAGFEVTEQDGVLTCPLLLSDIHRRLAERASRISGSSSRISRALMMSEPPSLTDSEITAKGNLNPRKVQIRRASLLERLYDDADATVAKL